MSSLTASDLWPIDPITDDEYAGRTSAVRAVAAEDVVVVTEDGHELLTDLPRGLFPGEQN